MKYRYCALMPMKGHSERVTGKNLREIAGRPLCLWMLEMLASVPEVERILVDTDSDDIAKTAQTVSKVEVISRPSELCGDYVSMNRILAHDLTCAQSHDHFVQTHATNPLLRSETLARALTRYESGDGDSVFSVTRRQARFFDEELRPVNHDPKELLRTQDLPPLYEENSNFYIFSRDSFFENDARIGARPAMVEVPALEAVDIDTPEDWELAEALLVRRQRGAGGGV